MILFAGFIAILLKISGSTGKKKLKLIRVKNESITHRRLAFRKKLDHFLVLKSNKGNERNL
jgi:hypothetical protein